jgi:hypothetical protein
LRAASLLLFTLPGARLVHEGQLQGARIQLPVQLGRRPLEETQVPLEAWHKNLLAAALRAGRETDAWSLCPVRPLDTPGFNPWIAYQWRLGSQLWLVVVNFSPYPAQGQVEIAQMEFGQENWNFADVLNHKTYTYAGADLKKAGLYVALPGWDYHLFRIAPAA